MSRPRRGPIPWPAFPDIPIFLEAADERSTAKTYGTTPTTPTTPEISPEIHAHNRPTYLRPGHTNITQPSPTEPSPTTTIQTTSDHLVIWPIPEPPPEIQQQQQSRRPALRFFPTERPRVRLDNIPTLQIPQINEKTPVNNTNPGLGIFNGLSKPPSIEISPPEKDESTSLPNIAQRIEETLWRYSASGNILKRWLLEVISWTFSVICMAAVIGVLIQLKDKPLKKWALAEKTGLTLNAYISILSKMAGAALILPVSEALGQLKWSWFLEHSKQMWDFEIFDNASRGPWGSLLLLIRTKGKSLAALGAMIMLCSLALDPFFQQVVDFPDRWALQNTSSAIPRIINYNPNNLPELHKGIETLQYDNDFSRIVKMFFYSNGTEAVPFGNGTRPDIPLSCPTMNCTWPQYETLAVCSSCSDVSASLNLTYDCLNTTIDWSANWMGTLSEDPYPNGTVCGYFLNATSVKPILMSGYIIQNDSDRTPGEALLVRTLSLTDPDTREPYYGVGSINYKDVSNTILDALIASSPSGANGVYQQETPTVQECLLSWCVQTIKSSYNWGTYSENITSTYLPMKLESSSWPWEFIDLGPELGLLLSYTQNITVQPPHSNLNYQNSTVFNSSYEIDSVTAMNAMRPFDEFFPSYYTTQDASTEPVLRFKNFGIGPYTKRLPFNPWQAPNNLTRHMERLASSMTSAMRSSVYKVMIPGEAYNRETYVSVRWEWLTLPLGLLCISFVFLAATVAKSAVERDRVGVWKTSAYATLLYGLPDEMQRKLTRSASTGTPRSKAKELKVKLQPNHGWRMSGNLFSPFTPKPKPPLPPPGWI